MTLRRIGCAAIVAFAMSRHVAEGCDVAPTRDDLPLQLIARAELIVVATASQPTSDVVQTQQRGLGSGALSFAVRTVLKGTAPGQTLVIRGYFEDRDDFHDSDVLPRTFVRPGGRHGNCFALNYRKGANYLLFLRWVDGELTPYWSPLTPINEQVKPDGDEWVAWVRRNIPVK
jgi:hypothetical protein